MDNTNMKILGAINTLSPMSFVSPIEVNKKVKLDKTDLGERLMLMKKSGYVDVGRVCGVLKSANNGLGMHSTRIYADSI